MPQQISDAELRRRQDAGAPYRLPSGTIPQHANAPRQAAGLPQSSAALQQYAAAASSYPGSSNNYTTGRPQAMAQQVAPYPAPSPTSAYATTSTPRKRKYSRKRIMIVSFEDHDFNKDALKQELHAVAKLFVIGLGFEKPTYCTITDSDDTPTDQLIEELTDFVESCEDTNELLVIYYSGHGGARSRRRGLMLANQGNDPSQTVYWNRIQKNVLFKADADVLVILDCCYAEMGVKGLHKYRRDTIAACASDKVTEQPGNRSFTACMIQAAYGLLANGGFFVKQLYNEIERIAAEKWVDGAARAERPIYHEQKGDKTDHEIYLERAAIQSSARASHFAARPTPAAGSNRSPISSRRGASAAAPPNGGDDDSSSSEETDNDEDEDDEEQIAQARASTVSEEAWQQHRLQARSAWSRMMAQGQTPSQAFDSLVRTWQAKMHLSSRDADAQVRRLLAG